MATYIIFGVIVIFCVLVGINYFKRIKKGESCCSSGEEMPTKVKVADRNTANYPYSVRASIDGMTCANCVRRVENALNSLPETYAKVDIEQRCAKIYCKRPCDKALIKNAIRESGYTVLEFTQTR